MLHSSAIHHFFEQLSKEADYAVLLGGASEISALNQWTLIGLRPRQVAELRENQLTLNRKDTLPETFIIRDSATLFRHLEEVRQQTRPWPEEKGQEKLPFGGGLCGVFGYGFYRWCDPAWAAQIQSGSEHSTQPEMLLCEFEDWLLIRLEDAKLMVLSEDLIQKAQYEALWKQCLTGTVKSVTASFFQEALGPRSSEEHQQEHKNNWQNDWEAYLDQFNASFSQPEFEKAVESLKQTIYEGEIYQANLSIRFEKQACFNPYALYETICQKNPSPFAAFLKYPGGMILSNSPERLVKMNDEGTLETRPIAGTRGRGATIEEDHLVGDQLLANEKERAEHLMLVDLARNDLGRVTQPGSVKVDKLLILERYSHVTHLVSNVIGQRRDDATVWEIIGALFPGGTITGCPKIRCMEILEQAEPVARGFYTGSLGYIDAVSGALDFNILIRSLYLSAPTESYNQEPFRYNTAIHVGAGIVYDSVGAHEYRECLRKATALLSVLQGSEQAHERSNPTSQPDSRSLHV